MVSFFLFLFFCDVGCWNYFSMKLRCRSDYANVHFTRPLVHRLIVPLCTSLTSGFVVHAGAPWRGKQGPQQPWDTSEETIINKLCMGFGNKTAGHTCVCIDQNCKTKTLGKPNPHCTVDSGMASLSSRTDWKKTWKQTTSRGYRENMPRSLANIFVQFCIFFFFYKMKVMVLKYLLHIYKHF